MAYPIIISAVDRATETIDRIKAKVASITAPVARAGKGFQRMADASGLTKVGKAFDGIARFSLQAFRNIARIVAPLGVVTGALSAAGLVRMVENWAAFAQRLGFTAQRIGVTSAQLQGLEGASRLAGGSAGALDSSLKSLTDNITDAIGGRNAEALLYFNTLGIKILGVGAKARPTIDVLPELADKIAAIKDPALQARVATELLGGAAEELLPFIRRGAAGIQDLTQTAERYGVTNAAAVGAANDLRVAQTKLELAVSGLANSIAVQLAPVLGPLLTQFADWIAANREWIATDIGAKVQELGKFLQGIDWAKVGGDIRDFGADMKTAADAVGGFTRATEILFGLWATAKVAPIILSIGKLVAKLSAFAALVTGLPGWVVGLILGGTGATTYLGNKQLSDSSGGVIVGMDYSTGAPIYAPGKGPADLPGAAAPPAAPTPGDANLPRGLRNNNPLNLRYRNQIGTVGQAGGYGVYSSMQAGIAAAERQLLRYQERYGLTTVSQMISRWAPPGENDTGSYVADVAKRANLDPNAQVSMRDPAVAQAVLAAMARHETGQDVNSGVLAQGISMALGRPVGIGGAASPAPPQRGTLDVTVHHDPDTRVSAVANGNVVNGAPRIMGSFSGAP